MDNDNLTYLCIINKHEIEYINNHRKKLKANTIILKASSLLHDIGHTFNPKKIPRSTIC